MNMKHTPLYKLCLDHGCKMASFSGWELPMQFSGVLKEHEAVRQNAGLFDISHMGVLYLEGNNPKDLLQQLVPTDLNRIGSGEACYSVLLNEQGGIIDDLIIYDIETKENQKECLLIVINAACAESDTLLLKRKLEPKGIKITDAKDNGVLLALQGPKSQQILENLCETSFSGLPRFGHRYLKIQPKGFESSSSIFVSRTGYTGEEGFELLLTAEAGKAVWSQLIMDGVTPCGLGARDSLRLEAGMHLYGNDMNETTSPFEAGLGWLVHLEMQTQFCGREVLEQQAKEGIKKRLIGLKLLERGIARKGYPVLHQGAVIGEITSGAWSPTLKEPIALAYVPSKFTKNGTVLSVEIREKKHSAKVVKKPFYRRN